MTDATRLRAACPTINFLLEKGAKVILASHLGRPKKKVVEALRMGPVAAKLSELLGKEVSTLVSLVSDDWKLYVVVQSIVYRRWSGCTGSMKKAGRFITVQ